MARTSRPRRIAAFSLVAALVAVAVPLVVTVASAGVSCPSVAPAPLAFSKPIYIDKTRPGGEPVSVVAQDGSILVSAHGGTTHLYKNPEAYPGGGDFVTSYGNQTLNWRSTDGGVTWKYVGFYAQSFGPHTLTSSGFSDPDYAMDAGGRIYNTEIDLANDAVYSSNDDGQSYDRGAVLAASGDRPWLTGGDKDEVFLYVNSPHQLWRSTDGGLTFSLVTTSFPATSKLLVDPLNPHHGLIGPDGAGLAISADDGKTWKAYPTHLGKSTQFFGAVAVDSAGWAYSAAAGGYTGSTDKTPDGEVTFNYFNRETKEWGATPVEIPIPKGDAMWPWLIAGDDGRVALVWYQTFAGHPDRFFIYAAYTKNGHGSMVRCSDGKTHFVPPQFSVTNASRRAIAVGSICLDGTACNANPDFKAGDRRLGDFFTVNFDHSGRIFIASGDTMLRSPTGGPKMTGNPIFMAQTKGDSLLTKPIPSRKTRPVCPPPCLP
jgi:hypothetical protein